MPLHRGGSAFGVSNSAVLQNCLDLEQNWTFFKGLKVRVRGVADGFRPSWFCFSQLAALVIP